MFKGAHYALPGRVRGQVRGGLQEQPGDEEPADNGVVQLIVRPYPSRVSNGDRRLRFESPELRDIADYRDDEPADLGRQGAEADLRGDLA